MQHTGFDPAYLPATAAGECGVMILGVAPVDGTGDCRLTDYHDPDSLVLRMTHEQARHLYLALGHTLQALGVT